ncbi:MAG TPA: TerC family protein, partial [Casimicrobiaceae bacterium]
GGGLFLIWKSVTEIHGTIENDPDEPTTRVVKVSLLAVIGQIAVLDIVFSLDSVITAVGLVDDIPVMVIAILLAVGVMIFAAKPIGEFVERYPTIKMLALSFLVLVGFALIADGSGFHIPKGYIYFSMAFATAVELLNIRLRKRGKAAETE